MLTYKISKNLLQKMILLLVMLIPLIPLEGLYYIFRPCYKLLYVYSVFLTLAMVVIGLILPGKRFQIGNASIVIIIYAMINIGLTILKHGDLKSELTVWIYTLTLILIVELSDNIVFVLKTLLFFLKLVILLNLFLMIFYPKGMYSIGNYNIYGEIWILGYKSSLQYYVYPAIFFSALEAVYEKKMSSFILILIIAHIESAVASNSMLLTGLIFIDIFLALKLYKKNFITIRTMATLVIFITLLNILIVLYTNEFLSISTVNYYLTEFLHKDNTLSMRTVNWKAVLKAIKAEPIWGYGYTSEYSRTLMYGRETAHAHNVFLESLYEGGVVLFSVFAFFNIVIFKEIYKHRDLISAKISYIFLFVFYIMYIFENLFQKSSGLLWMIFLCGFYCKRIDREYRENNKNICYKI